MAKQATLKELVLGAVEGFLATNSSFSVFDVTQSIRQVVNSGAVEVPTLSVSNQAFKFDITHDDVKFYFNELYRDGLFSQALSRSFNGTYFIYQGTNAGKLPVQFSVASMSQAAGSAVNQFAQVLNSIRNSSAIAVPSAASRVQQAATGQVTRSEVVDRVRAYLQNCSKRGVNPTSRQIQSAIKRNGKSTGWSRGDLDQIRRDINSGRI